MLSSIKFQSLPPFDRHFNLYPAYYLYADLNWIIEKNELTKGKQFPLVFAHGMKMHGMW